MARDHILQDQLAISARKIESLMTDNKSAREDIRAAKNRVLALEKNIEQCEVEVRLSRLNASDTKHQLEQTKELCEREKNAARTAHSKTTKKAGAIHRMLNALKDQHSTVLLEVADQLTCTYAVYTTIAKKLEDIVSSSVEWVLKSLVASILSMLDQSQSPLIS